MKNKTIKEIITVLTAVLLALAFIGCPSDDICSHDYQYKTTTAATCIAEGAEIETCTKCDATRGESRPVAKLPHSFADGECTVCGATDPDYNATCTHDFQWKQTTAPTCSAEGAEIESCTKCNETRGASRPVAKIAHTFDDEKCTVCNTYGNINSCNSFN